jgi:membrane protein implicated in regulation of membrane protease activity
VTYLFDRPTVCAVPAWAWWLFVAAVLAVGESMSLTFVLGLVALGAAAAGGVAALDDSVVVQAGAFCGASLLLVVLVRPIAKRHRRTPAMLRTGAEALIGAGGRVVQPIDRYSGQVRLRGEVWSARLCDGTADDDVVPLGDHVRVLAIEGATALVYPADV